MLPLPLLAAPTFDPLEILKKGFSTLLLRGNIDDQKIEERDEGDAFLELRNRLEPRCGVVEPDGEETADGKDTRCDDNSDDLLLLASAVEVDEMSKGQSEREQTA